MNGTDNSVVCTKAMIPTTDTCMYDARLPINALLFPVVKYGLDNSGDAILLHNSDENLLLSIIFPRSDPDTSSSCP